MISIDINITQFRIHNYFDKPYGDELDTNMVDILLDAMPYIDTELQHLVTKPLNGVLNGEVFCLPIYIEVLEAFPAPNHFMKFNRTTLLRDQLK